MSLPAVACDRVACDRLRPTSKLTHEDTNRMTTKSLIKPVVPPKLVKPIMAPTLQAAPAKTESPVASVKAVKPPPKVPSTVSVYLEITSAPDRDGLGAAWLLIPAVLGWIERLARIQ
jgi:hypothetical protein